MLIVSAVLLGLTALCGLALAGMHFSDRELSPALAVFHGMSAATGLILLTIAMVVSSFSIFTLSALLLFGVAALGGFALLSFHARGRPLPSALVLLHALPAVSGGVLLLIHLGKYQPA